MIPFWKKLREAGRPRCAMVVVAAGNARRMGGVHKILQPLDGVPVLVRTLTSFQLAEQVEQDHGVPAPGDGAEHQRAWDQGGLPVKKGGDGFFHCSASCSSSHRS